MNKFKLSNLKKDIYEEELIKVEFSLGENARSQLLMAGELLELARIQLFTRKAMLFENNLTKKTSGK